MTQVTDVNTLLSIGKEEVCFRVTSNKSQNDELLHINVDIVYRHPITKSIEFYRNYYDAVHKYDGLCIQGFTAPNESVEQIIYDGIHFDPQNSRNKLAEENLQEMLKTIRPINRRLSKISEAEGLPRDFIDYLLRVGRVLKVSGIFFCNGNVIDRFHHGMGSLSSLIESAYRKFNEGYSDAALIAELICGVQFNIQKM